MLTYKLAKLLLSSCSCWHASKQNAIIQHLFNFHSNLVYRILSKNANLFTFCILTRFKTSWSSHKKGTLPVVYSPFPYYVFMCVSKINYFNWKVLLWKLFVRRYFHALFRMHTAFCAKLFKCVLCAIFWFVDFNLSIF